MIVGLCGAAGSGKTTAAQELVRRLHYKRHRFAGPLKDMLRVIGLTDAQVDGDQKEVPCDLLCGRTPRHAMQTIGTQWGRECIGEDFWIRAWTATLPQCHHVVVDDVRFDNEADAIRSLGGVIVRIDRPNLDVTDSLEKRAHASEAGLTSVDIVVVNDGTIDQLFGMLTDALYSWTCVAEARRHG